MGGHCLSRSHKKNRCDLFGSAAPIWSERQIPVSNCIRNSHRERRRGPRSKFALLRRSLRKRDRAPLDATSGEADVNASEIVSPSTSQADVKFHHNICILCHNIRSLLAHEAELVCTLSQYDPDIIMLQETWLDASVPQFQLPNYMLVSRRDRKDTSNRGGIVCYCKKHITWLVHHGNSVVNERSWHVVHLNIGDFLIGHWYRSDHLPHDAFAELRQELQLHISDYLGILLCGDLNIHHKKWLHYSHSNTSMGEELHSLCKDFDLIQHVHEPTRNDYLLDLALSNIEGVSVKVIPSIADHRGLLISLPLPKHEVRSVPREGWLYKKASWKQLNHELQNFDWRKIDTLSPDHAANFFMQSLWWHLCKHIPRKQFTDKKQTHAWLNKKCEDAISRKQAAEGTTNFEQQRHVCAQILREERQQYISKLREKIEQLPKNSKAWWKLNQELLHGKRKIFSIPPLKSEGNWITDSHAKANLFAKELLAKSKIPETGPLEQFIQAPHIEMDQFIAFRTRRTEKLFKQLDVAKATGNDRISPFILKQIYRSIALPFTKLCRRLFNEACWPSVWRLHLLCPIYKRKTVYLAGNYRGIHLTSTLSKVAEHIIGDALVSFLQQNSFGSQQWAFCKQRSAKDLVTALVLLWIRDICNGKKIGAYLSDIAAAFDRVFTEYLLPKLLQAGVGTKYFEFLRAYLQPRIGKVIVEGVESIAFQLQNTIFQGTVLGPSLWNVFFADVQPAASSTGGKPAMFADDLNVFQTFDRAEEDDHIYSCMQQCRANVHEWGTCNKVLFDASKEHFAILHPLYGSGEDFKLLGCMIDPKLTMHTAIDTILSRIRPKMRALLRTRGHYTHAALISQFKTHIWGLMECNNGAIFHAATSYLDKFDSVQRGFLNELPCTEQDAFLLYNFAPPTLRRDIGILGLLHKRVLGLCHPVYEEIFPWHTSIFASPRPGHSKQLYGGFRECHFQHALFQRSIFAMVDIYNNLSQEIVDSQTVSAFQSKLTEIARENCKNNTPRWQFTYNTRGHHRASSTQ